MVLENYNKNTSRTQSLPASGAGIKTNYFLSYKLDIRRVVGGTALVP